MDVYYPDNELKELINPANSYLLKSYRNQK